MIPLTVWFKGVWYALGGSQFGADVGPFYMPISNVCSRWSLRAESWSKVERQEGHLKEEFASNEARMGPVRTPRSHPGVHCLREELRPGRRHAALR